MRHHRSITINGQPRDEVALCTAEPIPGVVAVTIEFERYPGSDSFRQLRMTADESDYFDGAYHFRRWHVWPATAVGAFTARGVTLKFADGHAVEAPINDEIIADVVQPRLEELPVFCIR